MDYAANPATERMILARISLKIHRLMVHLLQQTGMKSFTIFALSLAIVLPAGGASAQPQAQPPHAQPAKPQVTKSQAHKPAAPPKIGARLGKEAQPFQPSAKSRFKAPPRGHEYQVMNGHIVEIETKSRTGVAVLGPLSALSR